MNHRYGIVVTILLVFAGMLAGSGTAIAQVPVFRWEKTYGGSKHDVAQSMFATSDGGYIIAGNTKSLDGDVTGLHDTLQDYWLVKTTNTGAIQWQKTLGGTYSELANCIVQTYDHGYIVAGYSVSNDGDVSGHHDLADYWVVKTNDSGGIEWQRSLGGTGSDVANCVAQTYDGGYIVVGSSYSTDGDVTTPHDSLECWLVRLSATGSVLWQKSLGGSRTDVGLEIQQTADTGFILVGSSNSTDGDVTVNHGNYDTWVVKLSKTGAIQWEKSLGGSDKDYGYGIKATADGGYIVAASSNSTDGDVTDNNGEFDYWLVKLSATGVIEWQKSIGGSGNDYIFSTSLAQTFDHGYIVAGTTFSSDWDVTGGHGLSEMGVVRLSATGELLWKKALGGSDYDYAGALLQSADSCYILAGSTYSSDSMVSVNHGKSDYWVVKVCDSFVTTGINVVATNNPKGATITPNPANGEITVASTEVINQISISNLLGQVVYSADVNKQKLEIDITALPAGTYFILVNNGVVRRFVKE